MELFWNGVAGSSGRPARGPSSVHCAAISAADAGPHAGRTQSAATDGQRYTSPIDVMLILIRGFEVLLAERYATGYQADG